MWNFRQRRWPAKLVIQLWLLVLVAISGPETLRKPVFGATSAAAQTCDVDLGFIVDSSGSIGNDNFHKKVLPFLQQVTDQLVIDGTTRSQVGCVDFSDRIIISFRFNQYSTNAQVRTAISNIEFMGSITNTPGGIDAAREQLFIPQINLRPRVPKVALLITDGVPNLPDIGEGPQSLQRTTDAANRLKALGVTVVAVGVAISSPTNEKFLQSLASSPDLYTPVANFNELKTILDKILKNVCEKRCDPLPSSFPTGVTSTGKDGCQTLQKLSANSACRVSCATGYVATGGNSVYNCTSDGVLIPTTLKCAPQACNLPASPPNSGLIASNTPQGCKLPYLDSGSQCTIGCAPGYAPTSSSASQTLSCALGVLTRPNLKCGPAPCTLPTLPANAVYGNCKVDLQSGSSCTIQCSAGYTAVGSGVYSCSMGQLQSTPTKSYCTPTPCQLPSPAANQNLGNCPTSLASGTTCNVACNTGYQVGRGSTQHSCLKGTLTPATATCVPKSCTIPAFPANAISRECIPTGTLSGAGGQCTISCPTGYIAKGLNTYTCSLGVLTQNPSAQGAFECAPESCTLPPLKANQNLGDCSATLGSGKTCNVACNTGYQVNGTTRYRCLNGRLTVNATAVCNPTPCTIPAFPPLAESSQCKPGGTLPGNGGQCTLRCATGYDQSGSGTYFCNLGVLTGNPSAGDFKCNPKNCTITTPPGTVGASRNPCVNGTVLQSGQSCALACPIGSTPISGNPIITCDRGSQTNTSLLNCLTNTCTYPPLANMHMVSGATGTPCNQTGGTLSGTQNCTLRCSPKTIQGTNVTAIWDCAANNVGEMVPFVQCIPLPCSITPPANTVSNCPANNTLPGDGGRCSVECSAGFNQSQGITSFLCLSGDLAASPNITCTPLPCPIPPVRQGQTPGNCSANLPGNNSSCSIACAPGYTRASGTSKYTCNAGRLSARPSLVCTPDPCNITVPASTVGNCPANGVLPGNGSFCHVDCANGYYQDTRSPGDFTCVNGVLTSEANFRCIPRPCSLPSPPPTTDAGNCDLNLSGNNATCNITCEPGYTPRSGSPTYKCNLGNLTAKPTLVCGPNPCTLSPQLLKHTVGCTPRLSGALGTCKLRCADGFAANNDPNAKYIITCSAGKLLNLPPPEFECLQKCWNYTCPAGFFKNSQAVDNKLTCEDVKCTQVCCLPTTPCLSFNCLPFGLVPYYQAGFPNIPNCTDTDDCTHKCCKPPQAPQAADCVLPKFPDPWLEGTTSNCQSYSTMKSGASCHVQCAKDHRPVQPLGTDLYVCNNGVLTQKPTLRCQTESCIVAPPTDNVLAVTCAGYEVIQNGQTCKVECAPGYKPSEVVNNSTVRDEYGCIDGVVVNYNLSCVPALRQCSFLDAEFYPGGTILNADACNNLTNNVGGKCIATLECAPGFASDAQIPFTCVQPNPNQIPFYTTNVTAAEVSPCRALPAIPCNTLRSSRALTCPGNQVINNTANCPAANSTNCAPFCCVAPDRRCSTLRPPVLSCPADTAVNNNALCPANAANCNSACCARNRPCSTINQFTLACPAGTSIDRNAICPGNVTNCSPICCKPIMCSDITCLENYQKVPNVQRCTLSPPFLCSVRQCCGRTCVDLWGALPIASKYGAIVYYAVKMGPDSLPYCYSTDGRSCAVFADPTIIASLPTNTPFRVGCSKSLCKTGGHWCQQATQLCM